MLKIVIFLVSIAAILAALAIAAAGPGTRFGVWDFGVGLGILQLAAIPVLVLAVASLVVVVLALWKARGLAPLAILALIMSGGASAIPLQMKAAADSNPYIHDITTDFANPPQIIAAASTKRMNPPAYLGSDAAPQGNGVTISAAQQAAFPDIVPLSLKGSLNEVTAKAQRIVEAMGMEILLAPGLDGAAANESTIEAVATSTWFGFKDDFVVRLADQGDGSVRVDVRSKSRVGVSDLGANAARVRQFMKDMRSDA
jgi:uncharacterized protein (DUF1499 family)